VMNWMKRKKSILEEILNELQCPQVIMVSHERELESFADHLSRVEKSGGIFKIKAGLRTE